MPTVLVSRPGIMQQSLRSSLAACRGIVVIGSFGDGLTASSQVAKLRRGLLVIDVNLLDEEVEASIAVVKVVADHSLRGPCQVKSAQGAHAGLGRRCGGPAQRFVAADAGGDGSAVCVTGVARTSTALPMAA